MSYYNLKKIHEYNAAYNIIIGERSNGKTYATSLHCIKQFLIHGKQMAVIRRYAEDLTGRNGKQMFQDLLPEIEKFTDGQYNSIKYIGGRWYLGHVSEKEENFDFEPFAIAFALNQSEHYKSTSYPSIGNIVFDEFISRYYLNDEFVIFMNLLSTIIRQRDNVKIYMLGNTISKFCPYFKEMGLKHIKEMEPGQIEIYTYGKTKLKVAVEITNPTIKEKKSNFYFAFDNPRLSMITGKGNIWELEIFPHAPEKIKPKYIKFSYFIIWDDEIFQCDIIEHDNKYYTFIHRKTTEMKNMNNDIIYSIKYDPRPNFRRSITRPIDKIDSRLLDFFKKDLVFYQDNEVGDCIKSYLKWSAQGD